MSSGRRDWGRGRILKGAFALAYSGAAAFYAFQYVVPPDTANLPGNAIARIGPAGVALAVSFLGLPWSIAVYIGLAPSGVNAWAAAHKWVPMMLLFVAVGLNIALLWCWTLGRQRHTP